MGGTLDGSTITVEGLITDDDEATQEVEPALAVIWSGRETSRLGELLFPRAEAGWFGRDPSDGDEPRLSLVRQRPRQNEFAEPIFNQFLSRRHLRMR